ncbi:hypothetical protein SAMN05421693_10414 [Ectothiorhodospira magna]|uniref:DUF8042 domain-containing protein n=1 Tax=Ectothiorhodospira magna TaxID=867345 RepID=A0A1H9A272_9GAMM|nr:hypothetical protein [Ectothiorhodospira magna]SEP70759.1 hypothetical protein SAMN05421693_10414 [Ectothiorhodospira magna]
MNDQNLIISTSEEAEKYLERAKPALENLIRSIREFKNENDMQVLGQAVEGFDWLNQYAQSMQSLIAESYPVVAGEFAQFEKDISFIMSQMVEGSSSQDHILIADLMEYEVIPLFDGMKDTITRIINEIKNHS